MKELREITSQIENPSPHPVDIQDLGEKSMDLENDMDKMVKRREKTVTFDTPAYKTKPAVHSTPFISNVVLDDTQIELESEQKRNKLAPRKLVEKELNSQNSNELQENSIKFDKTLLNPNQRIKVVKPHIDDERFFLRLLETLKRNHC